MREGFTRRHFIKVLFALGIGTSISPNLPSLLNSVSEAGETGERPDIAVAHGSSPGRITEAAVIALGGIKRFISRGDVVFVKPNISWDRVPEQAATTHPDVVGKVVEMCFQAGAKEVKVSDNTLNDPRRCFVRSGIEKAVKEAGGKAFFMDDRKFKEVDIKGEIIQSWPVYKDILEADKIINLPIAKHHSLSRLTMGMKNWIGAIGGSRNILHQKIHASIVDFAIFFKPTLTILDAVRILTRGGPQGGSLGYVKRMDTVIAGVDEVAIDSYGATLFGLAGKDLGYVRLAHKRGVGTMDFHKLAVEKLEIG